MEKKVILAFVMLCFAMSRAWSQGYHIEVTFKGMKDSACILGHYSYTNTSFFAKDTATLDADGKLVFEGKNDLPGGLYLVLLPGKTKWVEVIYSGLEKNFSIYADTADVVGSIEVKGSEENRLFYDFNRKARQVSLEAEALDKELRQTRNNTEREAIQQKIRAAQERFAVLRTRFLADNKDSFAAKLIGMARDPDVSGIPRLKDGSEDREAIYKHYKAHFWDGFDFNDDRLLRTPFLQPKLERYFRDLVVQVPDSVCGEADRLIARSANKDIRAYLIYFVTREYDENSKIIGTEPVFIHMAEKYYLTGQIEVSEDGLKKVKERVTILKPLLPGKLIPNLSLSDTLKKAFTLHGIKAEYTILYFYSPSCSHCKESVPKLRSFYEKNKSYGVKILMVPIEESPEEWKKFIREYKLGDMIHGYDYTRSVHYRQQFDVYSTPTLYFLDRDKKIITRKVPTDEMERFFTF